MPKVAVLKTSKSKKLKHSDLKFIDKIGIELEGGWDTVINGIYSDLSVKVNAPVKGEICSPPLSLEEIKEWLRTRVPKYIDQTCGVHVHVSFKNKVSNFLTLMDPKFYEFFKAKMAKWAAEDVKLRATHEFWKRFRGENRFCRDVFQPEKQISISHKGVLDLEGHDYRYTQLNYCFSMHGTIECRLLPGFTDYDTTVSAIEALINCYEAYLTCHSAKTVSVFESNISQEEISNEW